MKQFFFHSNRTNFISDVKLVSVILCTSQFQNLPSTPGHFQDILIFFLSNSPVCWQGTWSNAPLASASESIKSSNKRPFNNFPMRQTAYSNVNILLNTAEISKVSESCLTVVCSLKCFIPEIPHLTGFLIGSQMLQQTLNIGAMHCTC